MNYPYLRKLKGELNASSQLKENANSFIKLFNEFFSNPQSIADLQVYADAIKIKDNVSNNLRFEFFDMNFLMEFIILPKNGRFKVLTYQVERDNNDIVKQKLIPIDSLTITGDNFANVEFLPVVTTIAYITDKDVDIFLKYVEMIHSYFDSVRVDIIKPE